MSRVEDKLRAAVEVQMGLDQDEAFLRNQWTAQCQSVTRENPGEIRPDVVFCLIHKISSLYRSIKSSR